MTFYHSKFGCKGKFDILLAAKVREGKKLFKCDHCDANFGPKGSLNNHILKVYNGKKGFKCDICNTTFGQKSNLDTPDNCIMHI